MLVNRQTINCAFAFSCKKFALFELTDPMRRKIFVQMFLQGEARLIALQVPKERLSGNLTSIGRICSNPLCLAGQYFLTGLWLNEIAFCRSLLLNFYSFVTPRNTFSPFIFHSLELSHFFPSNILAARTSSLISSALLLTIALIFSFPST